MPETVHVQSRDRHFPDRGATNKGQAILSPDEVFVPRIEPWIEDRDSCATFGRSNFDARALGKVTGDATQGEIRGTISATATDRDNVLDVKRAICEQLRCAAILAAISGTAFNQPPER